MSLIKRMRRQTAVYWKRTTPDHYANFSYAEPVEITCRWEDVTLEVRGDEVEATNFSSRVYVDRVMNLGDVLMLGALESDTPEDPKGLESAKAIQRFEALPNLKNRETLYTAYL